MIFKGNRYWQHRSSIFRAQLLGYPRSLLKPDVHQLIELQREACMVKAEYILSHLKDESIKCDISMIASFDESMLECLRTG